MPETHEVVRFQERRDASLLYDENPHYQQLIHLEQFFSETTPPTVPSLGLQQSTISVNIRRPIFRNIVFALWFGCVTSLTWDTPAGANSTTFTAFDQVSKSFEIPVTDPDDRTVWPSTLIVTSATLTTEQPGAPNVLAPKGKIYLSLQMRSEPVQRQYGQTGWGSFFSTLTPLPATALRYVTASGRSYIVTRADPINQTNNPNGTTDDGLVDATYYFTVPINNRRGTVKISPSRTVGVEYTNFYGGPLIPLTVGGPTQFALRFPKQLTAAPHVARKTVTGPYTTFASGLNLLSTVIAALLVGTVLLARRHRSKPRRPLPVYVVGATPKPERQAPTTTVFREPPPPQPQPAAPTVNKSAATETTLRIDVLGPLTISPLFAPASDPVRAIVAYLAMNNERILSLEEIQNAVWPLTDAGTDIKKPAMRNYIVDARKAVGERHLPTASGRPGYQLQHFETDWAEFQGLLAQAKSVSKVESLAVRRQALSLARGLPFTADTSRYFTWTFTSSVVYKIIEAVTVLAHGLGTELVLAGDLAGAQLVLRQGLLTDPASLTLWEDLTDVLLELTDQGPLELHWKTAGHVLRYGDVVALRSRANG